MPSDAATKSFSVDDAEVKDAIKMRTTELTEESWFDTLCQIEGVNPDKVNANTQSHIDNLKEVDNLYRLGRNYATAKKMLDQYKSIPESVYIGAMVPIALTVMFVTLAITTSGYYLFGLYLSFFSITLPAWLLDAWRRKNKLVSAPGEESKARTDLDRGIRSRIEHSMRDATQPTFSNPNQDYVKIGDGASLSSRVEKPERITTRYRPAIELHLLRTGGAAVGVTGERGTGKSELLRSFCDDSIGRATAKKGGTIGVFVAVPAAFKGIEFLTLVAGRLAQSVPGYRSPEMLRIAHRIKIGALLTALFIVLFAAGAYLVAAGQYPNFSPTASNVGIFLLLISLILLAVSLLVLMPTLMDVFQSLRSTRGSAHSEFRRSSGSARARAQVGRHAERLTLRLQYAETVSSQNEGSVSWKGVGLKNTRQRSLSSLPLNEASLISEIEELSDRLAECGYRILIGIDEMDKLEAGDATEDFLNSVKQLFSISSCSFLVSVSSSAWARFVKRGINVRDALDSSLDAIEPIDALDFLEARSLIRHRREEMSDSQIAFCYALAGGLPREIMRCARSVAMRNRDEEGNSHTLSAVADRVLQMEFTRLIAAIKSDLSAWEFGDRDRMLRILDRVAEARQNDIEAGVRSQPNQLPMAEAELALLSDSHRNEGELIISRLELMTLFFSSMRRLLCIETKGKAASRLWDDEAKVNELRKMFSEMSRIRRLIETDPSAGRNGLIGIHQGLDALEQEELTRSNS
jgi:hypothetical protein